MVDYKYIPTWLVLFLALGIYAGATFQIAASVAFYLCSFLLAAMLLTGLYINKKNQLHFLFTGLAFLLFFGIGLIVFNLNQVLNKPLHYRNFLQRENVLTLQLDKQLKPTGRYYAYLAEVKQVGQHKTLGNILLYLPKDSVQTAWQIGDLVYCKNEIIRVPAAQNPNQFSYRDYLEKEQVFDQIYLSAGSYLRKTPEKETPNSTAYKIRKRILENMSEKSISTDAMAIIQAMFLGQKQEMNPDLYNDYKNTGMVHILAISGLHIGILLLFLKMLLKPLLRFRYGKIIHFALLLLFLWFYAFLIGFSASVVRAATMFTAVLIGLQFKRRITVQNSLVTSLFFLLLLHPLYLWQVGFQMSYLAVFFIVGFQPLIKKMYQPKNKTGSYFWNLASVTFAAQLGVLPLSLYYFHQFSGLFLISSLIFLPALGLILGLGFVVIILAYFGVLPHIIAMIFGKTVDFLNLGIAWLGSSEGFVFNNIYLPTSITILLYIFLFLAFAFWKDRNFAILPYLFITIIFIQAIFLIQKKRQHQPMSLWSCRNSKRQHWYTEKGKTQNLLKARTALQTRICIWQII
ncbi:MAG: ComEC/Rec2 family competence protein [Flavobacteriaceae bacterium]|nr:ComEC/Rec2 family competence protein [Flavobacteriaceae bacterium]